MTTANAVECDALVVGGGAVGLSAARALGGSVVLVDTLPLHNELNASNDESKFFRVSYAADEMYTRMAVAAGERWRALEREAGQALFGPSGLALLSRSEASYALRSESTFLSLGLPVERWDAGELARRAPALADAGDLAVFDPSSALLDPTPALTALETSAVARGARILRGRRVERVEEPGGRVVATLDDGSEVRAACAVLATGFHTAEIVPSAARAIEVTRQAELFFAPRDPGVFTHPAFPLWAAFEDGFYGFPAWRGAVKVADHRRGRVVDPAAPRGAAEPADVESARAFLRRSIPALAEAPLARSRVCLYDNTRDEHFLLGAIGERTVLVAGLSGHGIKFAPLLGEIAAGLATGTAPTFDLERFDPARSGVELRA